MLKKFLRLAALGFVTGMAVGNIIAIISSYLMGGEVLIFSPVLLQRAGSPAAALAIQTIMSGVIGATGMGGVILYDFESWGMLRTVLVHYCIIIAFVLPIAVGLGWIDPDPLSILAMAAVEAAAYAVIWVIMHLKYRAEVKQLNELIAKSPAVR